MMRMILMSVSKHSRGQAGATIDQCALFVLLASRCNICGFAKSVGNHIIIIMTTQSALLSTMAVCKCVLCPALAPSFLCLLLFQQLYYLVYFRLV